MPRPKRAYVAKIRGCYECSQRRIHCDRNHPTCNKCTVKGIACSGYGIRYRFTDDVATRDKSGNRTRFVFDHPSGHTKSDTAANSNVMKAQDFREQYDELPFSGSRIIELDEEEEVEDSTTDLSSAGPISAVSRSMLGPLDAEKECLLTYFADNIAPEMVALDDERNGWRHLILPVAYRDGLIRDAVLAASTFHLSSNLNDQLYDPRQYYYGAINKLRKRQDLNAYDSTEKQIVLLSLLVLLSAVVVNGSPDFRSIFNLLDSALAVVGEESLSTTELGLFIIRQMRKYRGYASSLLSLTEGVSRLSQTAPTARPSLSPGWDDFRTYYKSYPSFEKSMSLIYDLNEQVCDIYVARASAEEGAAEMYERVEALKSTMMAFPPDDPTEHCLVWPTFIGAIESSTVEHRQYFTDHLLRHYQRNGFSNILKAVEYIKRRAERDDQGNWARELPNLPCFIV